jgi:hypothetical protein
MMLCPLEAWAQEEGGTEETSAEVVAENPAESDCERAASPADFYMASDMGEQAFVDLDLDGLMVAQADALWALRCANQQISDKMAAAFHRLMAFSAFTEGDDVRVLVEFHAARRLEPGYLISAEVVPEGHPLRLQYEAATDTDMGAPEPIYPPTGGYVVVDGVRGAPRFAETSCIVQVFDVDHRLVETVYMGAGDVLQQWGPVPGLSLERFRRPLASGTVAAVAATGILYGLAWREWNRFQYDESNLDSVAMDNETLLEIKSRNNTYVYLYGSTGALAVGLGVLTWKVWQ